jgi:hypothetical protein
MKWQTICGCERNAPYIARALLSILTKAAVGWGLKGGSSNIRTITPKEDMAVIAGAFRKEELIWKPRPDCWMTRPQLN